MSDDLTREVAARLGVTPAALRRSEDARALADRAQRMKDVIEALQTAERNLPRLARTLADDDDLSCAARVAELLGLVDGDATVKEVVVSLRRLGSVDDLPQSKAAKPGRGEPTAASRRIMDLLGQQGPMSATDIGEALGLAQRSMNGRLALMARAGRVTRLDDGRYGLAEEEADDE